MHIEVPLCCSTIHMLFMLLWKDPWLNYCKPTLPQLTPFRSELILHYFSTGIFGLSLDFALWCCKWNNILCQSKIKQLYWCSWNTTHLHQQKIWPNFQPFLLQSLSRNARLLTPSLYQMMNWSPSTAGNYIGHYLTYTGYWSEALNPWRITAGNIQWNGAS